jgi:nucleoside-diphosphate-sugar epimerase
MKALVTGGGGFLGGAIVRRLLDQGWSVRTLQRGHYAQLEALGVEQIRGDISDAEVVGTAVEGVELVFHVAAKVEPWGPYPPFYRTNVVGTENVLAAMRRHGAPKLVYTSTPSVIHSGGDLVGVDESAPYPDTFEAAYPHTKALAEMAVLAANDGEFATIALRPRLIWGPGDTNLVPQLVERARAGKLRFVGDGSNLVDTVYIDNAVDAHMLAAEHLVPGAVCAGKAYFISNGEPWPMKKVINSILDAAGLPPEERSVPLRTAMVAGAVFEALFKILPSEKGPRMNRFMARNMATAHWFDITAARRDLGYEPRVSMEEGLVRLKAWFEEQAERDTIR